MKRMLRKKMPLAITCWSVIIGMLLLSSPAFSKQSYTAREGRNTPDKHQTYTSPVKHTTKNTPDRRHTYDKRDRSSRGKVVHHNGNIIPAIVATGLIAGITFSLLDNNTQAAPQQAVATTCPVVTPPVVTTSSVVVTADLLNVRSGPGLGQAAIRRVSRGTVLPVVSSSGGWYMVKTPDGATGWVMIQFTSPVAPPVSG